MPRPTPSSMMLVEGYDRRSGVERREVDRRHRSVASGLVLGQAVKDRRAFSDRRRGLDRRWPFLPPGHPLLG